MRLRLIKRIRNLGILNRIFFNLLEAQRSSFDKFKFENNIQGVLTTCSGVEAVVELENVLEVMRELLFR